MSIRSLAFFNGAPCVVIGDWLAPPPSPRRALTVGTTRREEWGLLPGHQRGPRPGHQWGLFHGHGQPTAGLCVPTTVRPVGRRAPPDVVRASRRSGRMRSRVKPTMTPVRRTTELSACRSVGLSVDDLRKADLVQYFCAGNVGSEMSQSAAIDAAADPPPRTFVPYADRPTGDAAGCQSNRRAYRGCYGAARVELSTSLARISSRALR